MVLAMAQYRLNDTNLAHATLAEGGWFAAKNMAELSRNHGEDWWNDRIIANILMREAQATIGNNAISKSKER